MRNIHGLLHLLKVWLAPAKYAREVEKEIRFHLDLEAMHRQHAGASLTEAAFSARRQFGNVTYIHEEVRHMSGLESIDRLRLNLSYALRGLSHSPAFTLGVAATLGLGLGVNAAMFDFLDRVFVRAPDGISRPEQIRRVYIERHESNGTHAYEAFRYAQVRGIARAVDTVVTLGMFTTEKDTVTIVSQTKQLHVQRAMANAAFFRTLGIRYAAGRGFDSTEDRIDVRAPVAVISYDLWQRMFDGHQSAVGTVVRVSDQSVTIVGVTAKGFAGIRLDRADFWMPSGNYAGSSSGSVSGNGVKPLPWYEMFMNDFAVVTRISDPAVERRFLSAATQAYRGVIIPHWGEDSTAILRSGPVLASLGPVESSKEVSISLRLGGVSFIVLLIALANVSNLLLVRASKRRREFAVRQALGASRGRLLEQFVTESIVLALISLAVTLLLAFWVGSALRSLLLPDINWAGGVLDVRSLTFVIVATLLVGLVIGVAPALHARRSNLISSLRAGSKDRAYRRSRMTTCLVVAQAALSVILLVGAGLFVRSLSKVQSVDVGFDKARTLNVWPLADKGGSVSTLNAASPLLLQRLSAIPGVEAIAMASQPSDGRRFGSLLLPGRTTVQNVGGEAPAFVDVTPDYFRAAGIRLVAGRVFTNEDRSGVVVGEAMAKAYWPGVSPIGECVFLSDKTRECTRVIGVVADIARHIVENARSARYFTSTNDPKRVFIARIPSALQRTVTVQLEREIRAVIPEVARVQTYSVAERLAPELRPWQLGAALFSAMGILALVVSAIGVYSVVSYVVSQRTNEMGIRIALGAQMKDITRLVVGTELRTVLLGIFLGVVMSTALSRLIASTLYGISARDPLAIGAAALILALIGFVASMIPARRAARVSPIESLRVD